MYVNIGRKQPQGDLVEMLVDCHARIRSFTEVASKLAASSALPAAEVREAAARVRRYFTDALPRHVCDEEESILPRLRGKSRELDDALARMHREHGEHERPLARLLELLSELEREPDRLGAIARELASVAAELETAFGEHLASEEAVVFPAIRAELSTEEQAAIVSELRARRSS